MDKSRLSKFLDSKTLTLTSVVSGVFSVIVIVGLAWYGLRFRFPQYLDDEGLLSLRKQIKQNADAPQLKESFRAEDLQRRQAYLSSKRKLELGAYLLLGGLAVFALSVRGLVKLNQKPPTPVEAVKAAPAERERNLAIKAVLASSLPLVLVTFLGFALAKPERAVEEDVVSQPVVVVTTPKLHHVPEHLRWGELRGPGGLGVLKESPFPATWNAEKNVNIVWKTKVPLPGYSSPVIWGDRLFLTGATRKAQSVFCFERKTGHLLWKCDVPSRALMSKELEEYEETGLAAPTPVCDGKRIYAFFGANDLAAIDFSGKMLWSRWFGMPESLYGIAASLRMHEGRIILQLDQGEDAFDGKSFLYAINPADGKDIWKAPREVPNSWSSPIIVNTGKRTELITAANPWAISYDPATGKELWRAEVLSGDVAPLPVYADGKVYVNTEYSKLSAIRTGGAGDVTETHVLWQQEGDLSDVAGPVTDGKYLLLVTSSALINCYDAKTGKRLWSQETDDGFWSSPTLIGRSVYVTDKSGKTLIFELTDKYELLNSGEVGEPVYTTPAFVDSKIYIRGKTHLFCIGSEENEKKDN